MKQRYLIALENFTIKHNMELEDYKKLQNLIPEFMQYNTPTDVSYLMEDSYYEVCLEELVNTLPDLKFKIKGKVVLTDNKIASEIHQDVEKMNHAIIDFKNTIEGFAKQRDMLNFNLGKNPVVINVQNDKLLAINELIEHKEADYETIQDELYQGWMIITTYVDRTMGENGDAKPTYVMGRYNSKLKGKEL